MKFIVDNMLGKLAKYLRMMGYDTFFPAPKNAKELIDLSKDENRAILTRNSIFIRDFKPENYLFIKSQSFSDQMLQVIKTYNLEINSDKFFTLCLVCNEPLLDISKDEVKGKIPEKVYSSFDNFMLCPSCSRIYWRGGHTQRMENRLMGIVSDL
jgi:hypothetical protein